MAIEMTCLWPVLMRVARGMAASAACGGWRRSLYLLFSWLNIEIPASYCASRKLQLPKYICRSSAWRFKRRFNAKLLAAFTAAPASALAGIA